MAFDFFKRKNTNKPSQDAAGEKAVMPSAIANAPQTAERKPDKVGRYPAGVHVPALESRRYLWTARAFAIGLYLSLVLNIALASALFMLAPLKTVEPYLVTFAPKHDQVVKVEPLKKGVQGFDLMTEAMLQQYVKYREEILPDREEMARRYSKIMPQWSTKEQFDIFYGEASKRWAEFTARRFFRFVEITVINRQGDSYIVGYETTDKDTSDQVVQKLTWQAVINVQYIEKQTNFDERYLNPLGFTVTSYNTSTTRQ